NAYQELIPGQSILIPKPEANNKPADSIQLAQKPIDYKYHTVGENETLFSLSKKYHSKIEDIVSLNNVQGFDIKLGQILIIPIYPDPNAPKEIDTLRYTYYEVQPKQGKWRVAYDHGITIDELERLNPEIVDQNLKVGQKLIVPKFIASKEDLRDDKHYIYHEVQPKETLYSLSKQYGLNIDDLITENPQLTEGLKYGQTIKIPRKHIGLSDQDVSSDNFNQKIDSLLVKDTIQTVKNDSLETEPIFTNTQPVKINLLDSMRLDRPYHLAILLPFKLSQVGIDDKTCDRLTSNNILSYYSGIKLAIDSLKSLGLNVQYDVFDTQGSPYVTSKILETTDLSDYDFVIGPVKKTNVEKVAHVLEFDNTPVAVHQFKDSLTYRNIVVTTSDNAVLKQHMLQYLKEKSPGKAINIIYDPTKKAEADSLAVHLDLPVVKIEGKETDNGLSIYIDDIEKQLADDKENYVILLSDDDAFIFTVLSTLNALNKDKNITLFTLDDKKLYEDDTNDRTNIYLANLNYHFPSKMIRLIKPDFAKKFKEKYHTLPDFVAVNGFDTTFDLLLRAANADNLFEGLQKIGRTSQTSKVYLYKHKPNTGFKNQGSVILRIGKDLNLHRVE
ncbi:MAG TPA: LysM peptidoglycan-binding domain-containing protein, partial [Flavobacteriales bacterium]|nr:LysM peptidoglycan-binding domain-containing protein [Flavobacteriales bacterium]